MAPDHDEAQPPSPEAVAALKAANLPTEMDALHDDVARAMNLPAAERLLYVRGRGEVNGPQWAEAMQILIDQASGNGNGSAAPHARVVRLADVEPQAVAWLWQDRIPLGKIALLIGDPGMAKTTVALDLAARVSIGACLPDGTPGLLGNVVILTAEDGLADTIRPRLDTAGADVSRVFALQAVRDPEKGEERAFCLSTDVEPLEELVRELTAVFVIVDPLDAYLAGVDTHRNAEVRTVLAPLAAMLERTGAAGLCVHHLNKDSSTVNALYRAGGSLAFVAAARSVLGVAVDPEDAMKERRLLLSLKLSLARKPEGIGYRVTDSGIVWDHDPVGVDAAEAFGSPHKVDSSALQAAKDLLREQLAGGEPVAQVLIEEAALEAGVSLPMLKKAKTMLGVQSQREGFGPAGVWYWRLTDDTP